MLANLARWLRPGGWLLIMAGHQAWTDVPDGWLGDTSSMWWSQADETTYRRWILAAGLDIAEQQFIPEGATGHTLFWARRPISRERARRVSRASPQPTAATPSNAAETHQIGASRGRTIRFWRVIRDEVVMGAHHKIGDRA